MVDIDGDGSFLMNCQELATAAIEGLDIKMFILNNQHLGMVVQWEDRFYKVPPPLRCSTCRRCSVLGSHSSSTALRTLRTFSSLESERGIWRCCPYPTHCGKKVSGGFAAATLQMH